MVCGVKYEVVAKTPYCLITTETCDESRNVLRVTAVVGAVSFGLTQIDRVLERGRHGGECLQQLEAAIFQGVVRALSVPHAIQLLKQSHESGLLNSVGVIDVS